MPPLESAGLSTAADQTLSNKGLTTEDQQKRFEEGMEVYRSLVHKAEHGDLQVQLTLARMRLEGKVVPKDQNIALFWLRKAAKGGLPEAETLLGQVLLSETSIATSKNPDRDIKEAFEWLYKASLQDEAQAQYQFASLILRSPQPYPLGYDKDKALEFLQRCIQNGQHPGCMKLGLEISLDGIPSLRISSSKMQAFRMASLNGFALQGNPNAQYLLAFEDAGKTDYWLKLSARSGHPEASYDLAIRVLDGLVQLDAQDPSLLELLNKSAEDGYAPAMELLGRLLVSGSRFPANQVLGQEWLDKAKKASKANEANAPTQKQPHQDAANTEPKESEK